MVFEAFFLVRLSFIVLPASSEWARPAAAVVLLFRFRMLHNVPDGALCLVAFQRFLIIFVQYPTLTLTLTHRTPLDSSLSLLGSISAYFTYLTGMREAAGGRQPAAVYSAAFTAWMCLRTASSAITGMRGAESGRQLGAAKPA